MYLIFSAFHGSFCFFGFFFVSFVDVFVFRVYYNLKIQLSYLKSDWEYQKSFKERFMEKTKEWARIWLCVGIVLMLISMIVVSLVQSSGGKVKVKDLTWKPPAGT